MWANGMDGGYVHGHKDLRGRLKSLNRGESFEHKPDQSNVNIALTT